MADYKSLTELKTKALRILTGLDPSQDPSVEDMESIGENVGPLLAQLAADQIVYIADEEEIPNEYFLPIARLLANVSGPDFGSPMNEQAKLTDEYALRRLTSAKPTYETLKADYF